MDCSPHQRTRRVLAAVAVTALASAATVFVATHRKPSRAGEAELVHMLSFDVEIPMTYVDPSLPLASDVFAKTPSKDDEMCPTF